MALTASLNAGGGSRAGTEDSAPSGHAGQPPVMVVGEEEQRCVWEIAEPATVFGPDTLCSEVERCFSRRAEASSVVVRYADGRLELVTRRRLTVELAGRLGHGRSLYGRRPVRALPGDDETLILER